MDLETLQQELFYLVKTGSLEEDVHDTYLQCAAHSPQLRVLHEIVLQWRCYGLERSCILTARLLKRRGNFTEMVRLFIRTQRLSPYFEEQATAFLKMLSTHPDSLIASVAQFEAALVRVRAGEPGCYVVHWDYDPYAVLETLAHELPQDFQPSPHGYRVVLAATIPHHFRVEVLDTTAVPAAQ